MNLNFYFLKYRLFRYVGYLYSGRVVVYVFGNIDSINMWVLIFLLV